MGLPTQVEALADTIVWCVITVCHGLLFDRVHVLFDPRVGRIALVDGVASRELQLSVVLESQAFSRVASMGSSGCNSRYK